ncbi:MAG: ABC transporter permease [Chloroflexota bacterium]
MTTTTQEQRNQSERIRALSFISPGLLWTLIFFLVPLLIMLTYSFWGFQTGDVVRQFTFQNYTDFATRAALRRALYNSLEVAVAVTITSVILAYPVAYIIAYVVPPRWQRLALLMAVLPFWTSYVVRSYSWLLILTRNGLIGQAMEAVGLEPVSLANSRTGTIIGFVHFFVMLLTLTIYANLVQIAPNYRRAAADLGASPWQAFVEVVLPLSIPGIAVGAFLTFVLCVGDYITPAILGGNNELLLPQAIMLQIERTGNFPQASALAMVLMFVVTFSFIIAAPRLRIGRV